MTYKIESAIFDKIAEQREKSFTAYREADSKVSDYTLHDINEKESEIKKYNKSLERANEAYELEQYTLDELMKAKTKWNKEIERATIELNILKQNLGKSER